MIETSVVAERFASHKPGYRLLECEVAALPYFSITARGVWQERKALPPIDEFILHAINAGVVDPKEVGEFLGLDTALVDHSLARLWQRDLVDYPAGNGGRLLRLTRIGERALEEISEVVPREGEIWFTFDRLAWRPSTVPSFDLVQPRDARDAGMRQISPRKGKKEARPDATELSLGMVARALKESMGEALGDADLLVVKQVDRGDAKFLPCHLLIFESLDRREHAFEIAIDGRLDPDAAAAIEAQGGIAHLGLQFGEAAEGDPTEVAPIDAVLSRVEQPVASLQEVDQLRQEALVVAVTPEGTATPKGQDPLTGRPASVAVLEARNLDTFEHRPFLTEALATARRRLLITSPWVRNAVVNKDFMDQLWALARRGVQVHVGYGIRDDADGCDASALERLSKLHDRFKNVTVGCLGDTHAKILIWDDHQIVTSFNWLSFRGDENRTYRQETGFLLKNNPAVVDPLYSEQRAAIEKVAPTKPTDGRDDRPHRQR
ncbi:MAG: hypothetical protein AB7N61_14810 [Acidimicrobiia bacterium]